MSQLTITKETGKDGGDILVVDCKHATTRVDVFLPKNHPAAETRQINRAAMALAIQTHYDWEPECDCSAEVN